MAVRNFFEEQRQTQIKEKLEEFKKLAISKDENQKINEWYLVLEYINNIEADLKKQKELVSKYTSFFSLLNGLLPRTPSIHDVIF